MELHSYSTIWKLLGFVTNAAQELQMYPGVYSYIHYRVRILSLEEKLYTV